MGRSGSDRDSPDLCFKKVREKFYTEQQIVQIVEAAGNLGLQFDDIEELKISELEQIIRENGFGQIDFNDSAAIGHA